MAAAASAERGGVQRDTYERVKAVLAANPGLTTRDAFARVAEETGRSVGTIQTSYYRIAREDPNTTVKARPRSGVEDSEAAACGDRRCQRPRPRAPVLVERRPRPADRAVPGRPDGAARPRQADRPRAQGPGSDQGPPAGLARAGGGAAAPGRRTLRDWPSAARATHASPGARVAGGALPPTSVHSGRRTIEVGRSALQRASRGFRYITG